MAEPKNTYTAYVNPLYTAEERRELGIEIINFITERTQHGEGIGGKPFKKYSPNYVKTNEFHIAGKKPGKANLSLTGDMLSSIEILDVSIVGKILLGFKHKEENDKSVWVEEKGYKFLGLSDKELQAVIKSYGPPSNGEAPADISGSFVESFVKGIFGR